MISWITDADDPTQARDRFSAGVANNIEVVQAQEAVARANEQYIAALYGYNLATGLLTDGIRIYGHAGARMTVRDNHLERFDVGIAFTTRILPVPRLWVITHNLAANAAVYPEALALVVEGDEGETTLVATGDELVALER